MCNLWLKSVPGTFTFTLLYILCILQCYIYISHCFEQSAAQILTEHYNVLALSLCRFSCEEKLYHTFHWPQVLHSQNALHEAWLTKQVHVIQAWGNVYKYIYIYRFGEVSNNNNLSYIDEELLTHYAICLY